jgi:hypothetical protein
MRHEFADRSVRAAGGPGGLKIAVPLPPALLFGGLF